MLYGCNVWGLTSEKNLNIIEVLQKKCLRILTFSDFNTHTNKLFADLKLLKFRDIIRSQQLKLVYNFKNQDLPDDLSNLFDLVSDKHAHQTRSAVNNSLYIPKIKTSNYGLKSLKYQCPTQWNLLKNKIVIDHKNQTCVPINEIRNKNHFNETIKQHFIDFYANAVE